MQPTMKAAVTPTGAPSGIPSETSIIQAKIAFGLVSVDPEAFEVKLLQRGSRGHTKGGRSGVAPHRRSQRIIGKPEQVAGAGDLQDDDRLAIGPDQGRQAGSRQHRPGVAAAQHAGRRARGLRFSPG